MAKKLKLYVPVGNYASSPRYLDSEKTGYQREPYRRNTLEENNKNNSKGTPLQQMSLNFLELLPEKEWTPPDIEDILYPEEEKNEPRKKRNRK